MVKPAYFINSAHIFPQQGKVYSFGFSITKEPLGYGFGNIAAEPVSQKSELQELNPNTNKKYLQSYKIKEDEWAEVHESLFTG